MISGTFSPGEVIVGTNSNTDVKIKFRCAASNHKYGPYNSPTVTYKQNPYSSDKTIPEFYSSTTTILNVDTYSLANMVQGDFGGYIDSGMTLKGQTSGAEARINPNIKLVTDSSGDLIGCFFIPNRNNNQNPSFESGTRVFRLTNSPTNSLIDGAATTFSEEKYYSSGRLNSIEQNIVRNEPPQTPPPPITPIYYPPVAANTPATPVYYTPPVSTPPPVSAPPSVPRVSTPPPVAVIASPPPPPAAQVPNPWSSGDIDIRSSKITASAEGQRLVDSINAKNGTSFTVDQLRNKAGIKNINSVSDLNQLNDAARALAGR
jgi:hypothetical protein